ncbi:MAG: hypothetical protein ACE5KP_05205 [Dehalococcoidales bacterium]
MRVFLIALTLYLIVYIVFFATGPVLTSGRTFASHILLKTLTESLLGTLYTTPFIALGVLVIRGGFPIGYWSVILGICSLTYWFFVIVGVPVSLASIIVGGIALKKKSYVPGLIGILFGIIGMGASFFVAYSYRSIGAPFF